MSARHETTALLAEWASGNDQSLEILTRPVYKQLRQLAAGYLRKEHTGHTLQPTALVNEVYVRLLDHKQVVSCQNRSHCLAIAVRLMRQILVDYARRQQTGKRGGQRAALDDAVGLPNGGTIDLVLLDSRLRALDEADPRQCRAIEVHYFGGLTVDEIAQALDGSSKTVRRDLAMAEAWLDQRT